MIHFIDGKGRLHKGTVLNLRSCMKTDTLKDRQEPPGQTVACTKTAKTALHHEYRKELYGIFLLRGCYLCVVHHCPELRPSTNMLADLGFLQQT